MSDIRPPIPATCADRPTIGGLVIPWVNVRLADGGVDFRAQHDTKTQKCWRDCLCQICSQPIDSPIVLLGGPQHLAALQFNEPPLHAQCAVYTTKACPMVAGRAEHFADRNPISSGHRGDTCPDPQCDCGGWIPTPGSNPRPGGRAAHNWYAVYVTGYAVAVTEDRPDRIHSGLISPDQILVIRHVSTPGAGRTWTRTSLEAAAREAAT